MTSKTTTTFEIGDIALLKSDPNRPLTVIEVITTDETGADLDHPAIVLGHFTDQGEFETIELPAAALNQG